MLWDLHGDDELQPVKPSLLRGCAGYLLVIDGTRPATYEVAKKLHQLAQETLDSVPCVVLINKSDLNVVLKPSDISISIDGNNATVLNTSAKTGLMVEEAFHTLAKALV